MYMGRHALIVKKLRIYYVYVEQTYTYHEQIDTQIFEC